MKRLFASFLSISLLAAACSIFAPSATPPPDASPTTEPLETPWDDLSIFKDGLTPSAQSALERVQDASIYHIDFTIEETIYEISGVEEVRYTNQESVELREVRFRLFPNILGGEMQISNPRVDGLAVTPKYELENSMMVVPLSKLLSPGESTVIQMAFSVKVPLTVDQNYGVLAYAEDVLALAHAYPMIAVYNDEGWNAEIPPQAGDVTFADASFFVVRVTAPKDLVLVTSGREISREVDGQAQILHVASGPARDFYLAGSPYYVAISEVLNGVTIRSFAPKDLSIGSVEAVNAASRAMDVYSEHFAAYPYTELDIVSTPTLALGIEYPGIIAITSGIYDVESNQFSGPSGRSLLEFVVAHEMGHQWFYNLVGNDQLDDPWLDESLAQFATWQYFSDEYGEEGDNEVRLSFEFRWAGVGNADIPIGLPVASYTGMEYGAIVYGRGPLFFLNLRERMGPATYNKFIRDYTEKFSWGISTSKELQALAENHCTCDLDEQFNDWVYP